MLNLAVRKEPAKH